MSEAVIFVVILVAVIQIAAWVAFFKLVGNVSKMRADLSDMVRKMDSAPDPSRLIEMAEEDAYAGNVTLARERLLRAKYIIEAKKGKYVSSFLNSETESDIAEIDKRLSNLKIL